MGCSGELAGAQPVRLPLARREELVELVGVRMVRLRPALRVELVEIRMVRLRPALRVELVEVRMVRLLPALRVQRAEHLLQEALVAPAALEPSLRLPPQPEAHSIQSFLRLLGSRTRSWRSATRDPDPRESSEQGWPEKTFFPQPRERETSVLSWQQLPLGTSFLASFRPRCRNLVYRS